MEQGHTYQCPIGLTPLQRKELERFGRRTNKLGVNFAVCSHDGTILLLCENAGFKSPKKRLIDISNTILADRCGPMDGLRKADDRVQTMTGRVDSVANSTAH